MKHKTSSIPIKSSGMSQLLSYDSEHTYQRSYMCERVRVGAVVASFLSLALTPNSPPTPLGSHNLGPPQIWWRQNYQREK